MSIKRLIPKDGIEGLKENFTTDALSGFLVFLLAMPLSLGIAKASSIPTIFGLVSAIVGGVLVSFFMGSRLSIKGPAAGMIVIVSGSVAALGGDNVNLGWHLALGAAVVAGIVQILFGVLKLGNFADFFPSAAIHGMLAAIGVIIMAKQLHLLMGIDPLELKGKEPLELLAMLPASVMHENAHMTEIGIACLLIMILMGYVKNQHIKKIPAPLIVLAVSIPLGFALHIKTDGAIANFALVKIGKIMDAFTPGTTIGKDFVSNGFINADFSGITSHTGIFIQYVILYALIGSIESLLTAKAVDGMDPYKRKTNYNKDLWSVGLGNTISGFLGGLPMISEVARSSANVSYGARTRWSNFFHGLFLLLAILVAVPVIEMIPNVALAAMLVFVGFRLAHPRQFRHMWHVGVDQFIIFVATLIITLATDLLIGVGSGIVLELIVNLIHGTRISNLFRSDVVMQENANQIQFNVKGDAVFSNYLGLKKKLYALPAGKHVNINLSNCRVIDHTTLTSLSNFNTDYTNDGGEVTISGYENHHAAMGHDATSTRVIKNKT
ncbi:MAG: SulP family inorganic anion transporter [Bacteroidia bacterium]